MTLTRPWAIDAAYPNAADQRKQLASVYPRQGVFPDPVTVDPAGIAYAGSGWAINARPFNAVLKRGGAAFSQAYGSALCGNDAVVTGAWTISPAPASGSRIDRLCIRARDTTQGDPTSGAPADGPGGATRTGLPEFLVVTGVAGTSPVAPTLPAGYFEVGQVTTPSGAASAAGSTFVPTYDYVVPLGGITPVRNAARRDALSWMAGEKIALLDRDPSVTYTRVGDGWVSDSGFIVPSASQLSAEGGGSISVSADGVITFSGATAVNIDGIFDGLGMDSYEIIYSIYRTGSSGTGDWRFQYRAGGVTNVQAVYVVNRIFYTNSGTAPGAAADIVSFGIPIRGSLGTAVDDGKMTIINPKKADRTTMLGEALHKAGGNASARIISSVEHGAPTATFDGIRFLTSGAGTVNGTLRIRKVA